jgi:hypothetical protein
MAQLLKVLRQAEWTRPVWTALAVPGATAMKTWYSFVRRTSTVTVTGPGAQFSEPAIYVSWHRHVSFTINEHGRRPGRVMMMLPWPYSKLMIIFSRSWYSSPTISISSHSHFLILCFVLFMFVLSCLVLSCLVLSLSLSFCFVLVTSDAD